MWSSVDSIVFLVNSLSCNIELFIARYVSVVYLQFIIGPTIHTNSAKLVLKDLFKKKAT